MIVIIDSTEQIYKEGRYRSETILDSIADGIFTADQNFRIKCFNNAAVCNTGFTKKEAIGQYCSEIFRSSNGMAVTACFYQPRNRGRIPKYSRSNMKTDKIRVLYGQMPKVPFRLQDGTPVIKLVPKDKDKVVIHLPGGQTTEVYKRHLRKLLVRDSNWVTGNRRKNHDLSDESLQKGKDTKVIGERSHGTSGEKNRMGRFPEIQGFHPRRGKSSGVKDRSDLRVCS